MKRNIKDSLFRYIFKEPKYLKDLYTDISGKEITEKEIKVLNLKSYITNSIRNDIVFKKSNNSLIVLIEHQSSRSASMDIRLMLYYSRILEQYIKKNKRYGLFDSNLEIPKTEFYVLHNAKSTVKKSKDYKIKLLVDEAEKLSIDVRVKNINYDLLGEDILSKKDALSSYSYLIMSYYRNIIELENLGEDEDIIKEQAFNLALDELKNLGIYLDIFKEEGFRTVIGDILTIEDNLELQYDLGIIDGRQEGIFTTAKNMLQKGIDKLVIAECTGLTIEEIENL